MELFFVIIAATPSARFSHEPSFLISDFVAGLEVGYVCVKLTRPMMTGQESNTVPTLLWTGCALISLARLLARPLLQRGEVGLDRVHVREVVAEEDEITKAQPPIAHRLVRAYVEPAAYLRQTSMGADEADAQQASS